MEKSTDDIAINETLGNSGINEREELGVDRNYDIVTPPARENTENDIDYIDELDEYFGLSLDEETEQLKNLNIGDIPLDGKSPDLSSESSIQDNASDDDDDDGLNTERADYLAELEKVASQSDVDAQMSETEHSTDAGDHDTDYADEDDTESREATRDTDTMTPKTGIGYTSRTCTELQVSTWHSSLVTDCDSATRSGTSGEKMTSEAEARWNDRMSSGKKSAVQFYEDDDDDETDDVELSRNASRLALESREAMFRRAMTLLSARCTSIKQGLDPEELKVPFGIQVPKYFYVTQAKPIPMEPLKAWRGYNGNVYFQPIQVNPLKNALIPDTVSESPKESPGRLSTKQTPRRVTESDKGPGPIRLGSESRSESRQTVKSSGSSTNRPTTRQMAILDKQAVINRFNESLHEDIVWLEGQENTGSLAIRPRTQPNKERKKDLLYNKERICKGSVAHKVYTEKQASSKRPRFSVSGGKFTPPNSTSPLLRTQTQYSLSSNRLTTNSPDVYHLHDSKLPPLNQIKASLKHSEGSREKSYTRPLTITDGMKPFVKYSPDVVAKFAQQAL